MDLELLNWLKDGKYRIATLNLLFESPLLPSELAQSLDINRASMSRILKDLREKGLIEEISTNSRTITQKLTTKGVNVVKEMRSDSK